MTIASVMEFTGKNNAPETVRLVLEALVMKLLIKTEEVAKRLVEVALVKTPVEAVVAPIGVLLIVPLSIVRPSTTMASVTLLVGRLRLPVTVKAVIVVVVNKVLVVKVTVPFTN